MPSATPAFSLSCEFFPASDDAQAHRLRDAQASLQCLQPSYYSVTYGAGGTTQERTLAVVREACAGGSIPIAPHLTCIGTTRERVFALLDEYQRLGVQRLVALRGDLPADQANEGDFRYAEDLVRFIRTEYGDRFLIEVAGYPEVHPESVSAAADIAALARKVEAGADTVVTQYFYNADAFLRFRERCQKAGITVPIVAGIMPITNFKQLARFSDRCGAEIPRWLRHELADLDDDKPALKALGLEVVTRLCQRLLAEEVAGLHLYTMNQSAPSLALCEALNLIPRQALYAHA